MCMSDFPLLTQAKILSGGFYGPDIKDLIQLNQDVHLLVHERPSPIFLSWVTQKNVSLKHLAVT